MKLFEILICYQIIVSVTSFKLVQIKPGVLVSNIKQFWNNPNGTVSKFPPIIEYFVQRIQAANSNYVHEDLSRPPTWEKPVYTLSPADQQLFFGDTTESMAEMTDDPQISTTTEQYEYENLEETSEVFFEKINSSNPVVEYEVLGETTEKLFEIIRKNGTVSRTTINE